MMLILTVTPQGNMWFLIVGCFAVIAFVLWFWHKLFEAADKARRAKRHLKK
jgi:hypothetical protein